MRTTRLSGRLRGAAGASVLFVAYSVVTSVIAWPVVKTLTSRLIGDGLDPWQTLWGMWWWRYGIAHDQTLMFTRLLWWPSGASVWLESWDIPSSLMVLPFWSSDRAVVIYNCLVLLTFPLSGVAFYLLCRKLWNGVAGPAASGALYTFCAFHFANANAVLHMASMEWTPLYVMGLVSAVRDGSVWAALVGGAALGLATLASPYHALECAVVTLVLGAALLWSEKEWDVSWRVSARLMIAAATAAGVAGWYVLGVYRTSSTTSLIGAHDPAMFSADLQSLVFPNPGTIWSAYIDVWQHWIASHWTGATGLWAGAGYIGYCALGLALVSAVRHRSARTYLVVAAVGAVLALGPDLQIGGHPYVGSLPYAWLVKIAPFVGVGGIPSRFSALTSFGLAAAACPLINEMWDRGSWWKVAVVTAVLVAVLEVWPRFITSYYPAPSIFQAWRQDLGDWAVLDASWWTRAMYHQTLHHHPILNGYLTRMPQEALDSLRKDAAVCPFFQHLLPAGEKCLSTTEGSQLAVADRLRQLRVKFVVVESPRTAVPLAAGLVPRYEGEGLKVFEVPDAP